MYVFLVKFLLKLRRYLRYIGSYSKIVISIRFISVHLSSFSRFNKIVVPLENNNANVIVVGFASHM